jgi:hypothetical protein
VGIAVSTPTKLLAYDTFLQTEGSLTGKALPLGGTWAGAGDTDDFKVIVAEDLARRTAVSDDDLNTGRYAIAGSEEPTTAKVSVTQNSNVALFGGGIRRGVFLRYSNTENWLMAGLESFGGLPVLRVYKRVAGTVTQLRESPPISSFNGTNRVITSLFAGADGTWQAWAYESGTTEPSPVLEGSDTALAAGGTLEKGKGGIYDAQTTATAITRYYDEFSLLSGSQAGRVCFSGKSCTLSSDGFTRQDSTGKYEGSASLYRGGNLYLNPGLNRIVIAMRRNDAAQEADDHVTDQHTTEVLVRERFLAPR